ncbi:hypothetical protein Hs30E_17140 [Lactococcus hodotermopsidis]|uniref:DUF2325 domain-containing protein n=1 Tax=Pseudolactococcus hodotermopsidis TaxID=2709157 RepID=A0A6A0BEN7_9LACT|nr:DUF2325 domain-containing protein [Lactococcus hodotermopsidis]GFH43163.1 hypothetical protein Hs30E_17140 [Lactococcus hodotermopsidis]
MIKDLLKKILVTEIKKSSYLVENNLFSEFRETQKTQAVFAKLIAEGKFTDDFLETDQETVVLTDFNSTETLKSDAVSNVVEQISDFSEILQISESDSDIEVVDRRSAFVKLVQGKFSAIYRNFKVYDSDPDETTLDARLLAFIEKKAQFNKRGFPTNNFARALEFIDKKNEKVEVPEAPVYTPKPQELAVAVNKNPKLAPLITKGVFRKSTTGGFVNNFAINESLVRYLKFEEGQVLEIYDKAQNTIPFTVKHDGFERELTPSKIKNFQFGVVEPAGNGRFCVGKNINGDLLSDYLAIDAYFPSDRVIHNYKLEEDDIVELRWSNDNPETLVINWKYRLSDLNDLENEKYVNFQKSKKKSAKDKLEESEENSDETSTSDYEFDLQGHTVLVIGAPPYWGKWKQMIEQNNGRLLTYDSHKPSKRTMESLVTKSDVVIFSKNLLSHASWWMGKSFAKEYRKPYGMFDGFGKGTVFRIIEELLDLKEKNTEVINDFKDLANEAAADKIENAETDTEATIAKAKKEKIIFDDFIDFTEDNLQKFNDERIEKADKVKLAKEMLAKFNASNPNRKQRRSMSKTIKFVESMIVKNQEEDIVEQE